MALFWGLYEDWRGDRMDTVLSLFSKSKMWKLVLKQG